MSQFGNLAVRYLPQLWNGMLVTIAVAALAIGVLLTLPRVAGWRLLSALVRAYVEVVRNTPLLVQMYLLFFGLPLVGIFWDEINCGVLAVALQHAAFLSELFRSGIAAVGTKQWEALATGALIGWELLQREAHMFVRFVAEHYRPPSRPNHVYVINYKTSTGSWEPLFNAKGKPLYPVSMAELDAIKALRSTGGLMLRRDGSSLPWFGKGEMLT